MKDKYISINDLYNIIDSELEFIDTLNNEIDTLNSEVEHSKKKITYLNALQNYLIESDFCPIIRRKIIDSDILLQEFVTPLLKNDTKSYTFSNDVKPKDYGVDNDTIGLLLDDFIKFICGLKGHKIGVGVFHFEKFIREMCK